MSETPESVAPESGAPEAPTDDLRGMLEAAFEEHSDELPLAADEGDIREPEDGTQTPETASQEVPEGEAMSPPVSWTKEAQADWTRLPELIQREIHKRESEIQSKLSQDGPSRALEKVLEPHKAAIEASGITEAQYVGNLIQWNAALRQSPAQAIAALTQQFIPDQRVQQGVIAALQGKAHDMDDLDLQEVTTDLKDPRVDQLNAELQDFKVQQHRREFNEFSEATGPDGKKLRPYVQQVINEIVSEVQANPNITWEKAYEAACWKNAEVREKLIQAQMAERAGKRNGAATQARRMDLPQGRSDVGPINSPGEPLRDTIEKAFHYHS